MSHFTTALEESMQLAELNQPRLSAITGIDQSSISRFVQGKRIPTGDQLVRLVKGISNDRDIRLKLMIAFLRDVATSCHVAGFDERHYLIKAVDSAETTLSDDLILLSDEAAKHSDVRELLEGLSRLVRNAADRAASLEALQAAEDADATRIQKTDTAIQALVEGAEKRHRDKAQTAS